MAMLRDVLVALAVASAGEMLAVHLVAPQYQLAGNFSRSILRLFLLNVSLYSVWKMFIYPFFFSPLRELPGPKVRQPECECEKDSAHIRSGWLSSLRPRAFAVLQAAWQRSTQVGEGDPERWHHQVSKLLQY